MQVVLVGCSFGLRTSGQVAGEYAGDGIRNVFVAVLLQRMGGGFTPEITYRTCACSTNIKGINLRHDFPQVDAVESLVCSGHRPHGSKEVIPTCTGCPYSI